MTRTRGTAFIGSLRAFRVPHCRLPEVPIGAEPMLRTVARPGELAGQEEASP